MGDFSRFFIDQEQITTIRVIYYRLDYSHLLQEFLWQFPDRPPRFPRVHKFLEHWRTEVKAPIQEVQLAVAGFLVPTGMIPATIYQA